MQSQGEQHQTVCQKNQGVLIPFSKDPDCLPGEAVGKTIVSHFHYHSCWCHFLLCRNPLLWRTGRMLEIESKAETSDSVGHTEGSCVAASGALAVYWIIWKEGNLTLSTSSNHTFLKWVFCLKDIKHLSENVKVEPCCDFSYNTYKACYQLSVVNWNFCYKWSPIY